MNIVQIIPGSGGSFYCGNCLRDSKFYSSLKKLNHNVIKIPMYLPLFDEKANVHYDSPVFYGAVSLYLKQQYPIFKKLPRFVDKLLDSKFMLNIASKYAGSTRAEGLEDMTVSMLLGEDGNQSEELETMANWIETHLKPDIIHISNALLLGLAKRLKQIPNVKIVCSLQDEDVWVDSMHDKFQDKVWKLMGEKAADVDQFIAVSDYFAKLSIKRMNLNPESVETLYLGVEPQDYDYKNAVEKKRNIGFISRKCEANGLGVLIDAFIELKRNEDFKDVKLIITGGETSDDRKFLKIQDQKIKNNNLESSVEYWSKFDGDDRIRFYDNISVLSVPVIGGEAFGIYQTEAMASGIPIIQPDVGAFPEIIEKSKAGILFQDKNHIELALQLKVLFEDKELIKTLSNNAKDAAVNIFNINRLSQDLIGIYSNI